VLDLLVSTPFTKYRGPLELIIYASKVVLNIHQDSMVRLCANGSIYAAFDVKEQQRSIGEMTGLSPVPNGGAPSPWSPASDIEDALRTLKPQQRLLSPAIRLPLLLLVP
jgi:hypothetical protein